VIILKSLGGIKETIKNLEKIQGDIKRIDVVKRDGGIKDAVIKFKNGRGNWKVARISEEGSNLFCSFATEKNIFFKRQ